VIKSDITTAERAMFYGDTVFETIRISNGRVPLLYGHYYRLRYTLKALFYSLDNDWSIQDFERELLENAPPNARARFVVWRAPGGLYLPKDNTPHFAVYYSPLDGPGPVWPEAHYRGLRMDVCETARLPVDDFSFVKAFNAPRYVQASIEAAQRGFDELLMVNSYKRVCEATSSNVFWWSNGALYTPSLGEGCVRGVMRQFLFDFFEDINLEIRQISITPRELANVAQEIFLTNAVRGIVPVSNFSGKNLDTTFTKQLFDDVIGQLFPS
jgi:branched-chain amino acid aminotransferase